MNLLSLLIFGVLGVILDGSFGSQVEPSNMSKEYPWYSKLLDIILMTAILIGLIISIRLFPLGLVGLIAGYILSWMTFGNSVSSN